MLTYHVVPGKVMAEDVVKLSAAGTVNGQRVEVQAGSDGVLIDQARVVKADISSPSAVTRTKTMALGPDPGSITIASPAAAVSSAV